MTNLGAGETDFLNPQPVPGQLLAERLAAGSLSLNESLRIALEIGSALSELHSRGLAHGCLCPQTVMLSGSRISLLEPQNIKPGTALPYASPEVVRGEKADGRSDIFSFGAILYEMLGGHRAFAGAGVAVSLAILNTPPQPLPLDPPILPCLQNVVNGCLQKDPLRRRQRIKNVVADLKLCSAAERARAGAAARKKRNAVPLSANRTASSLPRVWTAVVVVGLAVLGGTLMLSRHTQDDAVLRFSIAAPENSRYPGTPAISPDGRTLAFSAENPDGRRMIWVRPLDDVRPRAIAGSEDGFAPFWSPDSRFLAFFARGALMKIRADSAGAKPDLLAATEAHPGGGTWNRDGVILYSPGMTGGIFRVSNSGGTPEAVLQPAPGKEEQGNLWPEFLPDGRHFLYFCQSGRDDSETGVYVASLDPGETRRMLFHSATNAVYSPRAGASATNGYLLYIKDRDLMVQAFDAAKRSLVGEAAPLVPDAGAIDTLSLAPVSASANAVLVYQTAGRPARQLVWMDRSGRILGSIGAADDWGPPRISPDGRRAACGKLGPDGKTGEIKIFSADGRETPFDTGGVNAGSPIWSPDGSRLAFWEADDTRIYDLYDKPVGGGTAERFYRSPHKKYPTDWSRDSKWVLFGEYTEDSQADVWAFQVAEGRSTAVLNTIHSEGYATLSPDGRWLAYQSDASGRNEVYVQPWDGGRAGTKRTWKVSVAGGGIPKWRADGGELFYITAGGAVMAAQVRLSADEFRSDPPQRLFQTLPFPGFWNLYDASPDGQRFLVNIPLEWTNASLLTVTTNWTGKLKL